MEHKWIERAESRYLTTRDGVRVCYQVVGDGEDVMILANGLGGRLYSWEPLLDFFAPKWKIITWDYRGLFDSDTAGTLQRLSIREHAEDANEILLKEGIEKAVFVGWSMGVQVSLETATLFPERVQAMVLLNGTYGHVLQTAFQPFFRVPWLNGALHETIDFLSTRPSLTGWLGKQIVGRKKLLHFAGRTFGRFYGQPSLEELVARYISDIFSTNFQNYLRLFQELDAHSVYHKLRDLKVPALIISGKMDLLTPAYQSKEMARKLEGSLYVSLPLGSHFVMQEFPERVALEISEFLESHGLS